MSLVGQRCIAAALLVPVALLSVATCADAAPSDSDLVAIAEAVATGFNAINGVPVSVHPEYGCAEPPTDCNAAELRPKYPQTSPLLVQAFARASNIPVHANIPDCPEPFEAVGLAVQFGEPQIVGDSARVTLVARCWGFGHGHEYNLRRTDTGAWILVSSGSGWIT